MRRDGSYGIENNMARIILLLLFVNSGYNFTTSDLDKLEDRVLTYHRIVESFKFGYAMRPHLGDPSTAPKANETLLNKVISHI